MMTGKYLVEPPPKFVEDNIFQIIIPIEGVAGLQVCKNYNKEEMLAKKLKRKVIKKESTHGTPRDMGASRISVAQPINSYD